MPELPEVETVCRELACDSLLQQTIKEVIISWPRSIATPEPEEFVAQVHGCRVDSIFRRGKYIIMRLFPGRDLIIHLRMTGQFYFSSFQDTEDPYVRVCLRLNNGKELRFKDTRKFGKWYLVKNHLEITAKLGPEPFDPLLTPKAFYQSLVKRKRQLKPLLLDQEFIAGIGNIYADEALWDAKLHPQRISDSLKDSEALQLLESIRIVLSRGLKNLGTSLGDGQTNYYSVGKRRGRNQDELRVFRRTAEPCQRCQTPIQRIIVGQRSTHFCSKCQRRKT